MKVLVAGGAGYIGSHAAKRLLEVGHEPVVLDNLARGHRHAVPRAIPFVEADVNDTDLLVTALDQFHIDCVMHFCALALVGESVEQPLDYYHNNVAGTVSLLRAMRRVGVRRMIFSSTCATYGEPDTMPLVESMPQQPINPYGWSKLMCERVLLDELAAALAVDKASLLGGARRAGGGIGPPAAPSRSVSVGRMIVAVREFGSRCTR